MSKSRFRILGLKMSPSDNNIDYVRAMQKSLYGDEKWIMFYRSVKALDNDKGFIIDNSLFDDENIYGNDSISVGVCAVVGKNGSGKSTIMDMMIRILNNIATSAVGENQLYSAAAHLHYIKNVHGAILYLEDESLFKVVVDGYEVYAVDYNKSKGDDNFIYSEGHKKITYLQKDKYKDDSLLPKQPKLMESLSSLFYTVVINYSMYAYYHNDYCNEATDGEKLKKLRRKPDLENYPYEQFWMTGLFHKNDGYQTPIVINPMRVGGIINAPKEGQLAKERIMSLLFVEAKDGHKKTGVYKYPFRTINGNLRIMALSAQLRRDAPTSWIRDWMVDEKHYFGKRSRLYVDYDTYSSIIIEWFEKNYRIDKNVKYYQEATRYLVYKIFKIGLTYLTYNFIISNLRHQDFRKDRLTKHLQQLVQDDTHITVKFRRTLLYLIYGGDIYGQRQDADHSFVYELKTIEPKIKKAKDEFNSHNPPFIAQKDDFLPPPIFDVEFRMVKNDSDGWNEAYTDKDVILFRGLSSGERQIAYTTSSFAYHLVNMNSVWKAKTKKIGGFPILKYKYVNAIFDEIELYYHPELQRKFLSLILNMLRDIELEFIAGVNIILVTHSPFVLSDIPSSNVLALPDSTSMDETFCANIHEMLSQSFFMQYTMGEVAQTQIEELFRMYREFSSSPNQEEFASAIAEAELKKYDYLKKTIADEYLRKTTARMLDEVMDYRKELLTPDVIDKRIQDLNEEITKLRVRKIKLEND